VVGLLGADVEGYFLEGCEMKLEVGKKYKTRHGWKITIVSDKRTGDDNFIGIYHHPQGNESTGYWYGNGKKYRERPDDTDIVAEWNEPKPPQYVPYTWEDREQLRGRWYRFKGYSPEHHAGHFSLSSDNELLINSLTSSAFLVGCEWLDGTPCGKVVE